MRDRADSLVFDSGFSQRCGIHLCKAGKAGRRYFSATVKLMPSILMHLLHKVLTFHFDAKPVFATGSKNT